MKTNVTLPDEAQGIGPPDRTSAQIGRAHV